LYYRLSVIQIDIPPLRERGDDVLLLAERYIAHFNERFRKRIRGLTTEVAEIFRRYRWPGNVRELRNVIERVMILEDSELITVTYLPRDLTTTEERVPSPAPSKIESIVQPIEQPRREPTFHLLRLPSEGVVLDDLEMSLVKQALERSAGNQTRAAELLGISRDQLRYRMKKIEEGQPN
jgi:transcriptional regulator with PAS, ATPase and Fis domain